jgi:hypothetical protein
MSKFGGEPSRSTTQPDKAEQKIDWSQKTFPDEAAAVQFIKDFWMFVNPSLGERIADHTAENLREQTADYRTVLSENQVTIYRNNSGPFSDKVVDFLKSKNFI